VDFRPPASKDYRIQKSSGSKRGHFGPSPEAQNVWIIGGGSGHGFKHGPVMGEMIADAILEAKAPPGEMSLGRLGKY
jgi:sarcosine oxidase